MVYVNNSTDQTEDNDTLALPGFASDNQICQQHPDTITHVTTAHCTAHKLMQQTLVMHCTYGIRLLLRYQDLL